MDIQPTGMWSPMCIDYRVVANHTNVDIIIGFFAYLRRSWCYFQYKNIALQNESMLARKKADAIHF